MFIDERLVDRLHDAVIRPQSIVVSESQQQSLQEAQERRYGLSGSGDANIPFVVKMAVKGEFGHTYGLKEDSSSTKQLSLPRTPERLLEELVAFYLAHFPERTLRVDPVNCLVQLPGDDAPYGYEMLEKVFATEGPRPIVLIDAPKGAKLMPMAGEYAGKVDVIYEKLMDEVATRHPGPAKRFDRKSKPNADEKAEVWKYLIDQFDPRSAMFLLEEAGAELDGARFEWLDFRLPWGKEGNPSPLHLHIVPAEKYSMGTFAHAFVNRGFTNGVRIVGSLKSGGDVNVLAIYER